MAQNDNICNIRWVKTSTGLVPANAGHQALYKAFVDNLELGQVVNSFFEAYKDDGTNLQLAKIHVCIRKLAEETGYTFEEMKHEVKRKAGLVHNDHIKSLGDCSVAELGLVIEALNEIGQMVNVRFDPD